jgi:hypothetical protein
MVVRRTPYMVVKRENLPPLARPKDPLAIGRSAVTFHPPGFVAALRASEFFAGDQARQLGIHGSGATAGFRVLAILMAQRRIGCGPEETPFSPLQRVSTRSVTRLTHSQSDESVTPAQGLG